jgi:hypothetical protein
MYVTITDEWRKARSMPEFAFVLSHCRCGSPSAGRTALPAVAALPHRKCVDRTIGEARAGMQPLSGRAAGAHIANPARAVLACKAVATHGVARAGAAAPEPNVPSDERRRFNARVCSLGRRRRVVDPPRSGREEQSVVSIRAVRLGTAV